MNFFAKLERTKEILRQQGRASIRALAREVAANGEELDELIAELTEIQRCACQDGAALAWVGAQASTELAAPTLETALSALTDNELAKAEGPVPQTDSAGERRQLTVMFCDLVDSTALSASFDPEELREIIRAYQARVGEVVARFDGHIAQYLGDGLLIYFGYPQAHEDDAQRALHAALGILTEIAASNIPLLRSIGSHLAVRVGIHAGIVVIGNSEHGASVERLAVGETPNIAARLQGVAAPGTIVISDAVGQLIGGSFDCADLGEVTIKGITQPVRIAQVLGVSTRRNRFEAATAAGLTPLVGRAQEIGLLTDRWQLAQEGEGQVVLISGEPGLGKSRLLRELREALGDTVTAVLRFQCSPYYTNSAYYPLVDHLERALSFASGTPTAQKLDQLEALVTQHGLPRQHAQLLAELLSLSTGERYPRLTTTPQRQKEDTLAAATDLTLAVADRQCALMLFEDVHWADPTTLEFLEILIDRASSASILIALTHRPAFAPKWTAHGHVTALTLSRLSRAQSGAIVSRLTAGKPLPEGLLEQLLTKTDGVPLFVEELTRSVLESGQLRDLGDRFEYTGTGSDLNVPATLRDSLMARLDRNPEAKEIAQIGAVIGRDFSFELLSAVATLDAITLDNALAYLVASGLAFKRGMTPAVTYTFKHALVQDTAYESLLKTRRQALHAAVANTLETKHPELNATEPDLLAHHHTAAGMPDTAIPLWRQAGALALARVAANEAISHLTKGLELLSTIAPSRSRDESELDLRVLLVAAWSALKGWQATQVADALQPAYVLVKALDHRDAFAGIYYGLAANVGVSGRIGEGLRWAGEALEVARQTQDHRLELAAELLLTIFFIYQGDCAAARLHAQQFDLVHTPEANRQLAAVLNIDPKDDVDLHVALWTWMQGFPDQALTAHQASVANFRASKFPFLLGYSLTMGALVVDFRRDPAALAQRAEEAMAFGRDAALPLYSELLGPMNLALATVRAGRIKEGIPQLRSAIAAWQASGANLLVPYFKAALAEAVAQSGDLSEALRLIDESIAQIERPGWEERAWYPENLRIKGKILARMDRFTEAEQYLLRAIDVAREQQAKSWELRIATTLAEFWQRQGKPHEARELLAPIYGWFTEGLDTPDLQDAESLLDQLGQQ